MQSGLYVALSSQIALERRLTTIADNRANMNTVGFRATQLKFDDVMTRAEGTRVDYVSEGEEYISTQNGGLTQTKNPLDFATKGDTWFSIETPSGNAITRDGRFSMLESGALVTLEGYPVLDAGGGQITLNPQAGAPELSSDGTAPVAIAAGRMTMYSPSTVAVASSGGDTSTLSARAIAS